MAANIGSWLGDLSIGSVRDGSHRGPGTALPLMRPAAWGMVQAQEAGTQDRWSPSSVSSGKPTVQEIERDGHAMPVGSTGMQADGRPVETPRKLCGNPAEAARAARAGTSTRECVSVSGWWCGKWKIDRRAHAHRLDWLTSRRRRHLGPGAGREEHARSSDDPKKFQSGQCRFGILVAFDFDSLGLL